MPRGNDHRGNGVGNEHKYSTNLAVSFIAKLPHFWTHIHLRDCLNHKLGDNRHDNPTGGSSPVVIFEQVPYGNANEYYVELRTASYRDRILEYNGDKIASGGQILLPRIEPWDRVPSLASPSQSQSQSQSHQYDRYRDRDRNSNDDNGDGRHSKRSKISISPPIRNNDKITSASGSGSTTNHEPAGNRSAPTTPATTHNKCDNIHLSKNPFQKPPKSFRDYLNSHLRESNMACLVFMSKIPPSMTLPELDSFVNRFMIKAGLFDRDIIVESQLLGKKLTTVMFLCISPDAAQILIDELTGVTLKNIKLQFRRHKLLHQQTRDTGQQLRGVAASNRSPLPLSSSNTSTLQTPPSPSSSNQTTRNTDSTKSSRFVPLRASKDICLSKVMLFFDEAIIDPGSGLKSAIVGAIRYNSHDYLLEANTIANASKLVKLSGILYDGTIELILGGEKPSGENCNHPSSTMEDIPTTVGGTSTLEMARVSDTMKAQNANLTKQVMKLLKENRDLKRINEMLAKAKNSSGSHQKPIELEVSSGEDMDLEDTDSGDEEGKEKISSKKQGKISGTTKTLSSSSSTAASSTSKKRNRGSDGGGKSGNCIDCCIHCSKFHPTPKGDFSDCFALAHESMEGFKEQKGDTMKRKSELEKINQLQQEFTAVKDTCKVLERQIEESKKEVNDDYERRVREIDESRKEQNTKTREQNTKTEEYKEEIERLRKEIEVSKNELAQEETEKKQLDFRLQENAKKYQEMVDALTRSTIMIQEEAAVRKSMSLSIVGLRKAKKRAEKELKAHKKMKTEDSYDF